MKRTLLLTLFLSTGFILFSKPCSDNTDINAVVFQPFHVTQTSIDQASGNDTLKVFFRMYVHDFLKDYKSFCDESGLDAISGIKDLTDEKASEYFKNRIQIYINGRLLNGHLVSQSNNGYEMILNLVFRSTLKPERFRIQNKVLAGIYVDQVNMVYININNYQEAFKLTSQKYKAKRKLE